MYYCQQFLTRVTDRVKNIRLKKIKIFVYYHKFMAPEAKSSFGGFRFGIYVKKFFGPVAQLDRATAF